MSAMLIIESLYVTVLEQVLNIVVLSEFVLLKLSVSFPWLSQFS